VPRRGDNRRPAVLQQTKRASPLRPAINRLPNDRLQAHFTTSKTATTLFLSPADRAPTLSSHSPRLTVSRSPTLAGSELLLCRPLRIIIRFCRVAKRSAEHRRPVHAVLLRLPAVEVLLRVLYTRRRGLLCESTTTRVSAQWRWRWLSVLSSRRRRPATLWRASRDACRPSAAGRVGLEEPR